MGSISVSNGSFTHTVSSPGTHPNKMKGAKLLFYSERATLIQQFSPDSYAEGIATFSGTISQGSLVGTAGGLKRVANCDDCTWQTGIYGVIAEDAANTILDSGSVSFSGVLPCSDCEGEDPPPPDAPPGGSGGDNPYGSPTNWEPGVAPPAPPPDVCLPPPFVNPPSPVPDPCGGGGSGGSGSPGFGNPTTP